MTAALAPDAYAVRAVEAYKPLGSPRAALVDGAPRLAAAGTDGDRGQSRNPEQVLRTCPVFRCEGSTRVEREALSRIPGH